MSGGVNLWGISQTLLQLQSVADDPEATPEEREAARGEIVEWVKTEVEKIDNIRAWLKHCQVMATACKEEKAAQANRAKMWEDRIDRMHEICLNVLESSQRKRIEGKTGWIQSQASGGSLPLEITHWDLIPDDYRNVMIIFPRKEWNRFMRVPFTSVRAEESVRGPGEVKIEEQIDQKALRKALESRCSICKFDEPAPGCEECRGTGRKCVAGSRLGERKTILVVK